MASITETLQVELRAALEATGLVQVRGVSTRHGDVRVMFVVTDTPAWLRLVSQMLLRLDQTGYVFLGEKVFINEGVLVRAWVLMIDTDDAGTNDVAITVDRVCSLLVQADAEVQENRAVPQQGMSSTLPRSMMGSAADRVRAAPTQARQGDVVGLFPPGYLSQKQLRRITPTEGNTQPVDE